MECWHNLRYEGVDFIFRLFLSGTVNTRASAQTTFVLEGGDVVHRPTRGLIYFIYWPKGLILGIPSYMCVVCRAGRQLGTTAGRHSTYIFPDPHPRSIHTTNSVVFFSSCWFPTILVADTTWFTSPFLRFKSRCFPSTTRIPRLNLDAKSGPLPNGSPVIPGKQLARSCFMQRWLSAILRSPSFAVAILQVSC